MKNHLALFIGISLFVSGSSCRQKSKVGIDGNNNDNNKVIITDNYHEDKEIPFDRRLDEEYLERALNPRFGFAFSYPKSWERNDSDNGDGHIVKNPKNPNIQIIGSGSWYDGQREYDIRKDMYLYEKEINIEYVRESSIYEFSWMDKDGRVIETKEAVYGEKACWIDGDTKVLAFGAASGERQMSLYCYAPVNDFKDYEDLFLKIISGVRFLKEYEVQNE